MTPPPGGSVPGAVRPAAEGPAVDLPIFSGPFRLLAELILDQKVDVCDVPVARITDGFVGRGVERMGSWSLEEGTWFLAICATLLELKVGRLLPRSRAETEEDLIGGVSADLVYARSRELAAFRRVSEDLVERMVEAERMLPRTAGPPPELVHLYPDLLKGADVEALRAAAAALLAPPPPLDLTHVTPIFVSVADAVSLVQARLSRMTRASFRDLLADEPERIEVVARFLALLELHRQGKVELSQAAVFGEIEVEWIEGSENGDLAAAAVEWDGVSPASSAGEAPAPPEGPRPAR